MQDSTLSTFRVATQGPHARPARSPQGALNCSWAGRRASLQRAAGRGSVRSVRAKGLPYQTIEAADAGSNSNSTPNGADSTDRVLICPSLSFRVGQPAGLS